ncbi:hypothetical protein Pan97_25490 [Bremerella volcania]|uniref:Uncharacterized protein n=1 Tax=Bremerella volcania TaxID=2527984 RepID=A0A518C8G0_9BACT|nr:hypothetical protein Pan97_25490 [Bremerella volcania]
MENISGNVKRQAYFRHVPGQEEPGQVVCVSTSDGFEVFLIRFAPKIGKEANDVADNHFSRWSIAS